MKKYILVLMAGLALSACYNHNHDHDHEGHDHGAEGAVEAHSSDEIVISEAKQAALGIRSETVARTPFSATLKTTGQIMPAQGSELVVVASTAGTITLGKGMTAGAHVGKGTSVARLSSKGLATSDNPQTALAALEAARNEYVRDSLLLADDIIPQNHFEQSRLAYIQAKSAYEAVASYDSSNGSVPVKSNIDGYVTGVYVGEGEFVEMGAPIMSISTCRRLTLKADVSARHAGELAKVVDANFVDASGNVYSVSDLGGRVLSYSKSVVDGYVPVIFEFNNSSSIVSGQFVDVILKLAERKDAVTVPVGAVVEEQGAFSVFVRLDEDCFMKRSIVPGDNDGVSVEVLSGLTEGDEVVVSGAMQVKLSSVAAVPAGHNHNH